MMELEDLLGCAPIERVDLSASHNPNEDQRLTLFDLRAQLMNFLTEFYSHENKKEAANISKQINKQTEEYTKRENQQTSMQNSL